MSTIDRLNHWKQNLRDTQASNIKSFRRYNREDPNNSLSNYFEGRMTATANTLKIFDYIIEVEELCNGNS